MHPDPEARAMLEAIRARRDDDAPRLIYADWLTARGDPLGEFVSIQCRLAAAPEVERRKLRVRENQLLKAHLRDWLAPVLEVLEYQGFDLPGHELVRGFLASLAAPTTVLSRLDALFAVAPLLEELTLRTPLTQSLQAPYPSLDAVARAPLLSRLTRLGVTAPAGNRGATALAECGHLSNLRALRFTGSVWGDDARLFSAPIADLQLGLPGVRLLATSPHLRGLRSVNLSNNPLGSVGAIATLGAWEALENLELRYAGVGGEFLQQLVRVGAPTLRSLSLAGGMLDEASLVAFAAAARALPALEELDLEKCDLGADTLAAFFKALTLPKLRSLRLERNRLGEKGALALAAAPAARQLDNLELGHNRIGQKGAAALASSPHLAHLTRLTLNDPWKPETVALFAKSPSLAAAKVYFKGKLVPKA